MSASTLSVTNIRAGYGRGADVLKGVSLRVESGAVVGLLGANGAGKSTLLNTICGYIRPRAGSVSLSDQDITALSPDRLPTNGIGYLMEGHSVFPGLTVLENLMLGHWSTKLGRAERDRAVEQAFKRSPILQAKKSTRAGLLSGGQQRILEMERLSLSQPSLIILDEVSLGLAPKLVHETFSRIDELRAGGASVLVVDQSARHVTAIADYIYVMRLGEIHFEGPAADFRDRVEDIAREFI